MKKLFIAVLFILLWAAPASAQDVKVFINGENVNLEPPPVIVYSDVLAPVRVFEKLGGTVQYIPDTRTIVVKHEGVLITMKLDSSYFDMNGETEYLISAPQIINGHAYLPLRILEYIEYDAKWNPDDSVLIIHEKSDAMKTLNKVYYNSYGCPYIKDRTCLHRLDIPFVFTGSYDVNLVNKVQAQSATVYKEGRLNDYKLYSLSKGSVQDSAGSRDVHRELLQDFKARKTYLNQGSGWSRYKEPDLYKIDAIIGHQHSLFSFFNLNEENTEMQLVEQEGKKYYVFSCKTSGKLGYMSPLVDILDSNFVDIVRDFYDTAADVKMTVDAEKMLIQKEEISIKYDNSNLKISAAYNGEFNYQYDSVPLVDDIVVKNTGLEYINDIYENEKNLSYGFNGELPGNMKVQGTVIKDGERYVKAFRGDKLVAEYYIFEPSYTRLYRWADDGEWKEDWGNDITLNLTGNKAVVIDTLNYFTAVPIIEKINRDGKDIEVFTFLISADNWADAEDLSRALTDIYGYSFDTRADGKFVIEVDREKNFIEALAVEINVIDKDRSKTLRMKFEYDLDQVLEIPAIEFSP